MEATPRRLIAFFKSFLECEDYGHVIRSFNDRIAYGQVTSRRVSETYSWNPPSLRIGWRASFLPKFPVRTRIRVRGAPSRSRRRWVALRSTHPTERFFIVFLYAIQPLTVLSLERLSASTSEPVRRRGKRRRHRVHSMPETTLNIPRHTPTHGGFVGRVFVLGDRNELPFTGVIRENVARFDFVNPSMKVKVAPFQTCRDGG